MDKVSRFRKHAEDCRELARAAESEEKRVLLHDLARHWEAIADISERLATRSSPRR